MGLIAGTRNQLDPNKQIWITEFGFYRSFHRPEVQSQVIISIFDKKEDLLNMKVTNLFYWTSKAYIMCDPAKTGCISYDDVSQCKDPYYASCNGNPNDNTTPGRPYGDLENGTLLMSPNFYPDPSYLNYGKKLGTISQVNTNISTIVNDGRISVNIPASYFQNGQEYILFMSSPTKIVTTKPWVIRVGSFDNPTPTPNPNCAGDRICDIGIWLDEFSNSSSWGSVEKTDWRTDVNCDQKVNLIDYELIRGSRGFCANF